MIIMNYRYALKRISPVSFGGGYRLVNDISLKELFSIEAKRGFKARVLRYWCYLIERTHKGVFRPDDTLKPPDCISILKTTLPIPDKEDSYITKHVTRALQLDNDNFKVALPRRPLRQVQRLGTLSQIKVFIYACLKTMPKRNNTFRIKQINAAKELNLCRKQVGLAIKEFKKLGFIKEIREPLPIFLAHGKKYMWN